MYVYSRIPVRNTQMCLKSSWGPEHTQHNTDNRNTNYLEFENNQTSCVDTQMKELGMRSWQSASSTIQNTQGEKGSLQILQYYYFTKLISLCRNDQCCPEFLNKHHSTVSMENFRLLFELGLFKMEGER